MSLRTSAIWGNITSSPDMMTIMMTKGGTPRTTSRYFYLKIGMAVKILHPKGGVVEPMAA